MRWIQRYVPEFEKRWNRFTRRAGRSRRVNETYVKIIGRAALYPTSELDAWDQKYRAAPCVKTTQRRRR
jgi:hypothetical protein